MPELMPEDGTDLMSVSGQSMLQTPAAQPFGGDIYEDPFADPKFVEAMQDGLQRRAIMRRKRSLQYQNPNKGRGGY
jgi:hypothetical protein